MIERLLNSSLWQSASQIGVTMARGFEWDTRPIIETAWKQNKEICVPKCNPQKREMTFYHLQNFDQLEVVYYHLLEPNPEQTVLANKEDIDLLIVPGIVFDKYGYRIGFGGGYYDRFLAEFTGKTASLVSTKQLVERLPAEAFDVPVQQLVNENSIMTCGG